MPKRKQFNDAPTPDRTADVRAEGVGEGKRKPITVTIPERLAEKARDVAYKEPGATVSGLVEQGLRRVLNEYGDVEPRKDERLPPGPPPSR